MFTSRAEYRLSLRADNADQRITPLGIKINLVKKTREKLFLNKQRKLISIHDALQSQLISPNMASKHSIKIAMDGIKRNGIELLSQKGVTMEKIRKIWDNIPQFEKLVDEQVEIDAHYSGYLKRQSNDIAAFKKDEAITIPDDLNYEHLSGLSNEIKSKLKLIKPKTLGQALRIDGVTPAAAIILLAIIKKNRYKISA
jgi:tRNA uridine 5-carboxymethylaminomethyl modification enzyme